jgi:hypothetical protein
MSKFAVLGLVLIWSLVGCKNDEHCWQLEVGETYSATLIERVNDERFQACGELFGLTNGAALQFTLEKDFYKDAADCRLSLQTHFEHTMLGGLKVVELIEPASFAAIGSGLASQVMNVAAEVIADDVCGGFFAATIVGNWKSGESNALADDAGLQLFLKFGPKMQEEGEGVVPGCEEYVSCTDVWSVKLARFEE